MCVSDGMKGGTPDILYDLCLGLDKRYSEPILPEPTRRKFHAKTFCHMEHDDVSRMDLLQVMETLSKVKDADGKRLVLFSRP